MSDQVDLDLKKLNEMVKFLREEALNPDRAPSHWEISEMNEAAMYSLKLDAIINDLKSSQMTARDLSDAVYDVKNIIAQVRPLCTIRPFDIKAFVQGNSANSKTNDDPKLDFDQWNK